MCIKIKVSARFVVSDTDTDYHLKHLEDVKRNEEQKYRRRRRFDDDLDITSYRCTFCYSKYEMILLILYIRYCMIYIYIYIHNIVLLLHQRYEKNYPIKIIINVCRYYISERQ